MTTLTTLDIAEFLQPQGGAATQGQREPEETMENVVVASGVVMVETADDDASCTQSDGASVLPTPGAPPGVSSSAS